MQHSREPKKTGIISLHFRTYNRIPTHIGITHIHLMMWYTAFQTSLLSILCKRVSLHIIFLLHFCNIFVIIILILSILSSYQYYHLNQNLSHFQSCLELKGHGILPLKTVLRIGLLDFLESIYSLCAFMLKSVSHKTYY